MIAPTICFHFYGAICAGCYFSFNLLQGVTGGAFRGGRHGLWQAGAAYVAAIALLFQALLFPAGCVTGAQDSPDASFGSLAGTWICTAQHGDDGKAQHPGGSKSGHDNGACCLSAACCAAILAVANAAIDLAPSSKQIFVPESWRAPAGTATRFSQRVPRSVRATLSSSGMNLRSALV